MEKYATGNMGRQKKKRRCPQISFGTTEASLNWKKRRRESHFPGHAMRGQEVRESGNGWKIQGREVGQEKIIWAN